MGKCCIAERVWTAIPRGCCLRLKRKSGGTSPAIRLRNPLERNKERGARSDHHKKIREPPPLQHADLELRHARPSLRHGEGGRRIRGPRRAHRRGYHPPG